MTIREAWRYQGPFTRFQRYKGALPGFGIGVTAFILFNVYEQFVQTPEPAHH